jgi:hypothetical protein
MISILTEDDSITKNLIFMQMKFDNQEIDERLKNNEETQIEIFNNIIKHSVF